MEREDNYLKKYQSDITSQHGEDGVIEKIMEILDIRSGICVEFGAWDGKYLSNTWNLVTSRGWKGVFIEGSSEKFPDLKATYAQYPNTVLINQFVQITGKDSLDDILLTNNVPEGFDLLSIDIDGNDYYIWQSVSKMRPKLVVIEFNPTIPNEIEFVQECDFTKSQGSSIKSLQLLGKSKGYALITTTLSNAFFIRNDLYPKFGIGNNSTAVLRAETDYLTYIFHLYDGTIKIAGATRTPWHGIKLKESSFQRLPRFLRFFPDSKSSNSFLRKIQSVYILIKNKFF